MARNTFTVDGVEYYVNQYVFVNDLILNKTYSTNIFSFYKDNANTYHNYNGEAITPDIKALIMPVQKTFLGEGESKLFTKMNEGTSYYSPTENAGIHIYGSDPTYPAIKYYSVDNYYVNTNNMININAAGLPNGDQSKIEGNYIFQSNAGLKNKDTYAFNFLDHTGEIVWSDLGTQLEQNTNIEYDEETQTITISNHEHSYSSPVNDKIKFYIIKCTYIDGTGTSESPIIRNFSKQDAGAGTGTYYDFVYITHVYNSNVNLTYYKITTNGSEGLTAVEQSELNQILSCSFVTKENQINHYTTPPTPGIDVNTFDFGIHDNYILYPNYTLKIIYPQLVIKILESNIQYTSINFLNDWTMNSGSVERDGYRIVGSAGDNGHTLPCAISCNTNFIMTSYQYESTFKSTVPDYVNYQFGSRLLHGSDISTIYLRYAHDISSNQSRDTNYFILKKTLN